MGGEAVAQGMRSDALVDIGGLGGFDDDAVELARADRRCGALSGEEPAIGNEDALLTSGTPPVAQQQEQAFGQHRVAVAAAFTALDPQQHALTDDMGHLQRKHHGSTQSATLGDRQRRSVLEPASGPQQTANTVSWNTCGALEKT